MLVAQRQPITTEIGAVAKVTIIVPTFITAA